MGGVEVPLSTPDDSITVRYTAKELFARIDGKLDVITATLANKADHEALGLLETRVEALETVNAERIGAERWFKAAVLLLLTIAGLMVPVALHYLP